MIIEREQNDDRMIVESGKGGEKETQRIWETPPTSCEIHVDNNETENKKMTFEDTLIETFGKRNRKKRRERKREELVYEREHSIYRNTVSLQ